MNEKIRQNLIDAGCGEEFIKECAACMGDEKQCEKLLAVHRRKRLDEVHVKERCISCLDYLVFMIKKEGLK